MLAQPLDPRVPDCSDPKPWIALGEHFRSVGLTLAFTAGRQRDCDVYPDFAQQDRLYHLYRNDPQPASVILQLFTTRQPFPQQTLSDALSPALFDFAVESGLLLPEEDGFASPFQLQLVNHLYLLVDYSSPSTQSIMAMGPTTQILSRASYPQQPIGSLLDMGCGCGILALLLAPQASRVVGVDINPRAVAISRINAALNGITHAEFFESDLFSSLAGQSFDLIVSQPPFVPRLAGEEPILYLHGGERGDEVSSRLLQELPAYLNPDAAAFVLSDFGASESKPFSQQLPRTPGFHTSVFVSDNLVTLERHSVSYLHKGKFLSGDKLWEETERSIAQLRSMGVDHLRQALVVVRAAGQSGLSGYSLSTEKWNLMQRALIDQLFWLIPLCEGPPEALLPLRLRVTQGTRCRQEWELFADSGKFSLQAGKGSLLGNPSATEGVLSLLQVIHSAPCVQDALAHLQPDMNPEFVIRATKLLQQLLLHGILEISPSP